jgi:hypothetical protein
MSDPLAIQFDSPEHREAQANCHCFIRCAVDARSRRRASRDLEASRSGSSAGEMTRALASLSGRCCIGPRALRAGDSWGVFDSTGSLDGPWQLQRHDDVDDPGLYQYDDDLQVWRHVAWTALYGDPDAIAVLEFLKRENPEEWVRITDHAYKGVPA